MLTETAKNAIRARLRMRIEAEKRQAQLLDAADDFHETIRMKLSGLNDSNQFLNFERCGHEQIYRTCKDCGKTESFTYRCNIKWCPRCQQRLTAIRRRVLQLWTRRITQPKHLVLTQRNLPVLTRKTFRQHTVALARMRRSKCFRQVKGGCVSTEVTNEGNGWHVHSHWLLDCRWLDMEKVSIRWGVLVKQNFAIVKVKDCRNLDYIQEVCKYVAKGDELAKWEPDQINEFTRAIRGIRMFSSFGSLWKLAPEIRRELAAEKPEPPSCECGSDEFSYESEAGAIANDADRMNQNKPVRHRPEPVHAHHVHDDAAGVCTLPLPL